MSDQPRPKPRTNSDTARIGDTPLALGVERFSNASTPERSIWRLSVRRYVGGDPLIEIDATQETMEAISTWLDRATELVHSDGNRLPAGGDE